MERLTRSIQRARDERGFTLIELLVVVIILGVLAGVVVFATRGTGDKGVAAAYATDAKTLRTAQEAYCANHGYYATSQDALVAERYLSEKGTYHEIVTANVAGNCGTSTDPLKPTGFRLVCDATQAGCGAGGASPAGGTLKVPGTWSPPSTAVGNVTGNNFVNPAVGTSGTAHPNVEYMFNGLLRWGESNTAQPDLAQSFTVSADQKTVSFTLRPGMVWHNNTPILNTDVDFTFRKALFKYHSRSGPSMVPALGGSGGGTTSASVVNTATSGIILSETAPGANDQVTFKFVYAYPPFLRQMNVTEAAIIPQNVYGPCDNTGSNNINTSGCPANNPPNNVDFPADTGTNKKPVGSGPFRFKRRDDNSGAVPGRLLFVKRSKTGAGYELPANGAVATPYHLSGLPLADDLVQVPTPFANVADFLLSKQIDVGSPANNRILPIISPQTSADITPANGFTLADVPRGTGGGNCITTFSFHLWQYGTTTNSIGLLAANAPYTHEFFGDPTPIAANPGAGRPTVMPRGKVVRRAVSMAIDRTSLFNAAPAYGKGRIPDSPYHSKIPTYAAQSAMPAFDPAMANTWLNDAGWTVQGGIRKANYTLGGVTAGTTPLAWAVRRASGGQDTFYTNMKTQLLASPINIDLTQGTGNHSEVAADGSTQVTGALVQGARNYDMLVVSFCNGDDPVIGVRRQYHSDGIPSSGVPATFSNPSGVRATAMDSLWDTAFTTNYTAAHQQIQALSADEAFQMYFEESATTRAWRTGCGGFNNFNTGLYVETAGCSP